MAVPMASSKGPSESSSLFQIASGIKDRLEDVPGIPYFLELCISGNFPSDPTSYNPHLPGHNAHSKSSPNIAESNKDPTTSGGDDAHAMERSSSTLGLSSTFVPLGRRIDPVTHLWQFFRLGSSLCALFNILQPHTPLNVIVTTDVKTCKRSVYDFVQACKSELNYSDDELFTISNVFSDNTTDLLKVCLTIILLYFTNVPGHSHRQTLARQFRGPQFFGAQEKDRQLGAARP